MAKIDTIVDEFTNKYKTNKQASPTAQPEEIFKGIYQEFVDKIEQLGVDAATKSNAINKLMGVVKEDLDKVQ